MNNQAAQTMPGDLRWKIDTLKPSSSGVVSLTQEEWAYVAAALAQTAGVAELSRRRRNSRGHVERQDNRVALQGVGRISEVSTKQPRVSGVFLA